MAEKAGSIEVEIRGNSSKLAGDLRNAKGLFAGFGKEIISILSVAALVKGFDSAVDRMDSLNDRAIALRTEIGKLQRLEFIAGQNGLEISQLNAGLLKMQATIGSIKGQKILANLGIDQVKFQALDADKQIQVLGNSISKLGSSAEKIAAARSLFGKDGAKFNEILEADLNQAGRLFDSLGIKITQAQADLAGSLNDNKATLSAVWEGFGNIIAAEVIGPLTKLSVAMIKLIQENGGAGKIIESIGNNISSAWNKTIKVVNAVTEAVSTLKSGTVTAAETIGIAIGKISTARMEWRQFAGEQDGSRKSLIEQENELAKLREKNQATRNGGRASNIPSLTDGAIRTSNIPSILGTWVSREAEARDESIESLAALTQSYKQAKDTFIDDLQKSDGKTILSDILREKDVADTSKPFQNESFNDTVRQIVKLAQELETSKDTNNSNYIVQRLPNLFKDLDRQVADSARAGENVFGAKGAIEELKDFVNKKASEKVAVDINVRVDKEGIIQVVATSDQVKTVIDQIAEEKMAKEARLAGAR